jgi:hypothetical protein
MAAKVFYPIKWSSGGKEEGKEKQSREDMMENDDKPAGRTVRKRQAVGR